MPTINQLVKTNRKAKTWKTAPALNRGKLIEKENFKASAPQKKEGMYSCCYNDT